MEVKFTYVNIFFRLFVTRDASFYLKLYKTYVLPILFYASPFCYPPKIFLRNKLERIQKYFTRRLVRRIEHSEFPSYPERLKLLGLLPINSMFVRFDLITLYKLIHGQISVPSIHLRFSSRVPHRLLLSSINTNVSRKFFVNRASCCWNRLIKPESLSTLHSFRELLSSDSFLSSV